MIGLERYLVPIHQWVTLGAPEEAQRTLWRRHHPFIPTQWEAP